MSNRPTYLYLVKLSDQHSTETFFKIGITTDLTYRFSNNIVQLRDGETETPIYKLKKALLKTKGLNPHPYNHEYLTTKEFSTGEDASEHEKLLLEAVSVVSYTPQKRMSGFSECFRCDEDAINAMVDYINGLPDGPPVEF